MTTVEFGRRYPSDEVLANMARVFGVSVEELKSYDTRAPLKELLQLAELNPAYGIALRKVVDKKLLAKEDRDELG